MRAPISVMIPTLNAADVLPGALAALGEGLAAGLVRELVVSDGGSGDATCALAEGAGAIVIRGTPGRGGQLRRAAARAEGDWLLVLHADSWLAPGWAAAVAEHLASNERPACFQLDFRAPGVMARMVAGWANLRSRVFGLPYGDQGLLVRRIDYDIAGGYPDIPLMEDVALVRRLQRIRLLRARIDTGAERYLEQGWLRRGARNLVTLARYLAGTDPVRLSKGYGER